MSIRPTVRLFLQLYLEMLSGKSSLRRSCHVSHEHDGTESSGVGCGCCNNILTAGSERGTHVKYWLWLYRYSRRNVRSGHDTHVKALAASPGAPCLRAETFA